MYYWSLSKREFDKTTVDFFSSSRDISMMPKRITELYTLTRSYRGINVGKAIFSISYKKHLCWYLLRSLIVLLTLTFSWSYPTATLETLHIRMNCRAWFSCGIPRSGIRDWLRRCYWLLWPCSSYRVALSCPVHGEVLSLSEAWCALFCWYPWKTLHFLSTKSWWLERRMEKMVLQGRDWEEWREERPWLG